MLKQSYIRKTRERPNSSPKQPREQVPSAHQSHSVEIVGLIVSKGLSALPNHSLERTRPAWRDTMNVSWPGRSARGR